MTGHFRKKSIIFLDTRDHQEHDAKVRLSIPSPSPEKLKAEIIQLKKTDLSINLKTPQRKYPASIKFSKTSSSCHKLAERISSVISREYELFHQAGKNDCTLLLLDRRDDVTTVSNIRSLRYVDRTHIPTYLNLAFTNAMDVSGNVTRNSWYYKQLY